MIWKQYARLHFKTTTIYIHNKTQLQLIVVRFTKMTYNMHNINQRKITITK
jgi:hypothetical protein